MGKVKILVFYAALCLFFPGALFSETILLKSGQKVEGRIIEKTDRYIKLEFQGTELVYYNDEIASIGETGPASVNPQLESFYKAYADSLKAPQDPKADSTLQAMEGAGAGQPDTGMPAEIDLSKLPSEYQKRLKEVVAKLQTADLNLSENE